MELSYKEDSEWLQQYSLVTPNVYPNVIGKIHPTDSFSQQFPNIITDLRCQTSFDGGQCGFMYYRNNITNKVYKLTNKDYKWYELEDEEAKTLLRTQKIRFQCITYKELDAEDQRLTAELH